MPEEEEVKRAHWSNQYAKYRTKKLEWIHDRRRTLTREQLDCQAAYQRQWRARNKEYVKMRRLEQYHKDPEKVRRARYWKNRTTILQQMKEKRMEAKQAKQKRVEPHQQVMTRWIVPKPPKPIEPAKTTMIELIQDLFPDILQVFLYTE